MWVSKIENRFLGDTRSRFPRRMLSPVESSYHVIFPRTKDPIHRMRVRLVRNDRNAACLIGISLSNARNPLANTRVIISSQTKRNDERSFCWVSKKIRNLRGIVARADNEEPGCIWFLESNRILHHLRSHGLFPTPTPGVGKRPWERGCLVTVGSGWLRVWVGLTVNWETAWNLTVNWEMGNFVSDNWELKIYC